MSTTPDPYQNHNASNYPYPNFNGSNPGDPTIAGGFPMYPHTTQYPYQPPQNYPPPPPPRKRWYQGDAGAVLMLFLFFPVGLYLMWRYTRWNKTAKWIVTGIFAFLVVVNSIANAAASPASVTTNSTPQPTIAQVTPTQVVIANNPIVKPTHASTPTPVPTTAPAQPDQPTQAPVNQPPPPPPPPACNGAEINGGCYNTNANGGTLVYGPPSTFCDYFTCVSTFWTATSGYVAECNDSHYTHSGGVSGACSRNGGVLAPVYRH